MKTKTIAPKNRIAVSTDDQANSKLSTNGHGKKNGERRQAPLSAPAQPGSYIPQPLDNEPPRFYYDKASGRYWRKDIKGEFVPVSETDLKRHCRKAGVDVDDFSKEVWKFTRFDDMICDAQDNHAVDTVIPLSGHKCGVFITEDKRKILVPHTTRLIVPKPGEIKNWEGLLAEMFGAKQLPYCLAWLKVMVEDLRTLNPYAWHQHQMLVLAGPPNCGKSFFQKLITLLVGGRSTDPYLWMVGKSNFNEDIAENEHLRMDDKQAFRETKARGAFAAIIKRMTVNEETAIHGKGKKQFSAPCFHRLTMSVNDDADCITALPGLEDSIADKLMIFKCAPATMIADYEENLSRFRVELPAFVHFLISQFQIPEDMRIARFGVRHYHNPEIIELLKQFESRLTFKELLDATFFKDGKEPLTKLLAVDIQRQLENGPYGSQTRQLLSHSSACGQYLGQLAKEEPARFEKTRTNGRARWTLRASEELF